MTAPTAYLGLGSNLDRPHLQLRRAVESIAALPACKLTLCSSIYRSSPQGPAIQPDFLNAVIAVQCRLSPRQLLQHTQAIEQQHKRKRRQHWGPRTLDIDILLFGQQHINTRSLYIPHKQLQQRNFVVFPLLEIAPQLRLPDGQSLQSIAKSMEKITLTKLPLRG